jgi:ubiquinone biosynthesis protein COQ9
MNSEPSEPAKPTISEPNKPTSPPGYDKESLSILSSALLSVPTLGWTPAALSAGCVKEGLPGTLAAGLFPRGGIELVDYFLERSLEETRNGVGGIDVTGFVDSNWTEKDGC